MIESEANWLFENNAEIMIQSYRMEIYYKYAEKLIKKNAVYVCTCLAEDFRKYSEEKEDCPCRNISAIENMSRWKKMLDKSKKGFLQGEAVLRFKSKKGMDSLSFHIHCSYTYGGQYHDIFFSMIRIANNMFGAF